MNARMDYPTGYTNDYEIREAEVGRTQLFRGDGGEERSTESGCMT